MRSTPARHHSHRRRRGHRRYRGRRMPGSGWDRGSEFRRGAVHPDLHHDPGLPAGGVGPQHREPHLVWLVQDFSQCQPGPDRIGVCPNHRHCSEHFQCHLRCQRHDPGAWLPDHRRQWRAPATFLTAALFYLKNPPAEEEATRLRDPQRTRRTADLGCRFPLRCLRAWRGSHRQRGRHECGSQQHRHYEHLHDLRLLLARGHDGQRRPVGTECLRCSRSDDAVVSWF